MSRCSNGFRTQLFVAKTQYSLNDEGDSRDAMMYRGRATS